MYAVNRNPSVSEVRNFGLVTLAGFAVIGSLMWYKGLLPVAGWKPLDGWGYKGNGWHVAAIILWLTGAFFAVVCTVSHRWGRRLYIVWMTGATYMGIGMSLVMLTILFFVFLPIFALIRLRDPLRLKPRKTGTCWEDHAPTEAFLERMARPF